MSAISGRVALPRAVGGALRNPSTTSSVQYGRTAAYRRLLSQVPSERIASIPQRSILHTILRSQVSISRLPNVTPSSTFRRSISYRDIKKGKDAEDPPSPPRPGKSPVKKAPSASEAAEEAKAEKARADERSAAEEAYEQARAEAAKEEAKQGPKEESSGGEEGAEGAEGEKAGKKGKAPPPPKHGNKTPWQVFTETLSNEFKASKEWNEGTKELSGSIHDFTQNPNVQKARSAYTKATDAAATTSSAALKSTAQVIGSGAAWTWNTPVVRGVRKTAAVVGGGLEKATRPVRETEAYKNVKEVIDDGSSSRYGGWTEKEERRRRREAKEAREIAQGKRPRPEDLEEDPNAGTNVTLHKDAAWKESWREFRDSSKLMQSIFSLKSSYAESENPLISTARSISDRVAGFFAENETAQVIKKFRELDPTFQLEPFLQEMREYILPEVLDAYVKGDVETLKLWLSAAQYQVYAALMEQYVKAGMKSDGRILDIRNVDILNARMLDNDIPVFVIMCRTQEVHVYRNAKSGELAAGQQDKVQQVTYAIGITRLPDEVSNPETRGWRLIELQKSARDYM